MDIHMSSFSSPVIPGTLVTGVSLGVSDGQPYETRWCGMYEGVRESEWVPGEQMHCFGKGILGSTPQGCFAIPVSHFPEGRS